MADSVMTKAETTARAMWSLHTVRLGRLDGRAAARWKRFPGASGSCELVLLAMGSHPAGADHLNRRFKGGIRKNRFGLGAGGRTT